MGSQPLESSRNPKLDRSSPEQGHIRNQRGRVASLPNKPSSTFASLPNLIEGRLSPNRVLGLDQACSRDASAACSRVGRHQRKLHADCDYQAYLAQPLIGRSSFVQGYNHKPSDRDILPSQRRFLQWGNSPSLQRTGAIRHTMRDHVVSPVRGDTMEEFGRNTLISSNLLDMCVGSNLSYQRLIRQLNLAPSQYSTITESQQHAASDDFSSCRPQTCRSYAQSTNSSIQPDSGFNFLRRWSNPSSRRSSTSSLESLPPSGQERVRGKRLSSLDPSVQFSSEGYRAKCWSRYPGPALEKHSPVSSDDSGGSDSDSRQERPHSLTTFGEEVMDWMETLLLDPLIP